MNEPTPEEILADLFTDGEDDEPVTNYPPQIGDVPFT